MANATLSLAVKTPEGSDAHVLVLGGELDIATTPTVRSALDAAIQSGHKKIVVDLTGLNFIDSTGLGVLIGGLRRAREAGGRVMLVAAEGRILRLLRVTGLLRIFAVYGSVDAALSEGDAITAS